MKGLKVQELMSFIDPKRRSELLFIVFLVAWAGFTALPWDLWGSFPKKTNKANHPFGDKIQLLGVQNFPV